MGVKGLGWSWQSRCEGEETACLRPCSHDSPQIGFVSYPDWWGSGFMKCEQQPKKNCPCYWISAGLCARLCVCIPVVLRWRLCSANHKFAVLFAPPPEGAYWCARITKMGRVLSGTWWFHGTRNTKIGVPCRTGWTAVEWYWLSLYWKMNSGPRLLTQHLLFPTSVFEVKGRPL